MDNVREIKIDRLALEGEGIGHDAHSNEPSSKVVFVPYSLPGESVRARIVQDKKSFSRGIPIEVLESSIERVVPRCGVHFQPGGPAQFCGGCDWQHVAVHAQRKNKQDLVSQALTRIGKLNDVPIRKTIGGDRAWNYRNKVQLPVHGRPGALKVGFFAPGSHHVVPINECPIQSPLSVYLFRLLREISDTLKFKPYDEDQHRGWLRHFLIRTTEKNEAAVALVTQSAQFPQKKEFLHELLRWAPQVKSVSQNVQSRRTNVILGDRWAHLWGQKKLEEEYGHLKIKFGIGSFLQVNTEMARRLFEEAINALAPQRNDVVWDLYCGVGIMTLMAAERVRQVVGIEENPAAIRNAIENAGLNRIRNVFFKADRVEAFLRHQKRNAVPSDHLNVIVDPPRSGLSAEVVHELIHCRPKRIVYVSCNPATLARDLSLFARTYKIQFVQPVDLFPQSSHIESITLLERQL